MDLHFGERRRGLMRYRVLGSIEVESNGDQLGLGGPQQRRLLGLLLLNRNRVVSADGLIDALWSSESTPAGAARSVPTYVSRLRAALGNDSIIAQGAGYRLDLHGSTCDIDEFEALISESDRVLPDRAVDGYDAARALWRGPPFGEFAEEWWALAES